ncbi:hypothetical protein N7540_003612 [Penicillium herquei]|nr:hypothetical protein N7540_003612 [Penicillium herquei]
MRDRCEAYIDFKLPKNLIADVGAATPGGFGAHAILLAFSEKPFQEAIGYARPHSTIVVIGMPGNAFLKAHVFEPVVKMINTKGSYVDNRQDNVEAFEFFTRGLIKASFRVAPLKDLPDVFELIDQGKITSRQVLELPG